MRFYDPYTFRQINFAIVHSVFTYGYLLPPNASRAIKLMRHYKCLFRNFTYHLSSNVNLLENSSYSFFRVLEPFYH